MPASDQKIHILLVEDNLPDARLVDIALRSQSRVSFSIDITESLSEARAKCQARTYDAILLDLSLPDSFGENTVLSLSQAVQNIPIIVLSGQEDEELSFNAIKYGAQDYIVKGAYDGSILTRIIMYAIERMHTQDALRHARDELELRVAERTESLQQLNRQLKHEILQRAKIEAEERRLEARYGVLLDNLTDHVVILVDTKGLITNWSKPVERLTGYSEQEIKGKPLSSILESKAYVSAWLNQAQKTGEASLESRIECSNGQCFWAEIVINPLYEKDDYQFGYSFLARDISQKRKLAEKERQQLQDIAHLNRISTMGEMATEIAHELNQPLAAISTYSSACRRLIQRSDNPDVLLEEALGNIEGQSRRAAEVIKRLRQFVAKDATERVRVDINEVIAGVVKLAEIEASTHKVEISIQPTSDAVVVRVDRILIEQVLLNLIRNALESFHQNQLNRIIIIESRLLASALQVRVKDQGKGISEDDKKKIFDRFYTTKKTGMGMGLAICRSIVESHNGELGVEDNQPSGTVFSFTLPTEEKVEA